MKGHMDFKYRLGLKVKHDQYGFGQINGRIAIRGKILLKDTYNVAFLSFGTKTVKEKSIREATQDEWISRLKIPS